MSPRDQRYQPRATITVQVPERKPQPVASVEVPPVIGEQCPHCGGSGRLEPVAVAAPVPQGPTKWRVVKGGTFAQNGAMAIVPAGCVVTAAAYGRKGIESMLGRGIKLDPID